MEKFKKGVNKLNQDEDFVQFLTKEDEERLLINTLKNNSYEEGVNEGIITTAKNMLNLGIEIDKISKATGLSIEEIENL